MKIPSILLATLLMAIFVSARAHGPTPQKVVAKVTISASPAKVWNELKDFDRIANWHPLVAQSTGDSANIPGKSTRILTLKDGGQITEGLDDFDPKQYTLSYRLAKENVKVLPVSFYSTVMKIEAGADESCVVEWKSRLYRADTGNFPAPGMDDDAAVKAMTRFFEEGLKGLKEYVEKTP